MRLFYFLLFLISIPAFAQDCHTSDLPTDGVFNCAGTLFIDTPLIRINPDVFTTLAPLEITAADVVVSANIILNGANGISTTTDNVDGAVGSLGASAGGGFFASSSNNGGTSSAQDGKAGANDSNCGSGGGGGASISSAGQNGASCSGSSVLGGDGGDIASFSLIGGFGGGAGGVQETLPGPTPVINLGLGGGGGGAIRITATSGTITIESGVRISARGGNGGNAPSVGGGGGGGGGGVIHLISPTKIINQGIFDVRGGSGGTSPSRGNGGRGGNGIFRFEENGVITDGTGLKNFGSSSKLTSDISCGTVAAKPDEKNNLAFQMMAGFMIVMFSSLISKMFKKCRINVRH